MAYCIHCGEKIADEAQFCSACGQAQPAPSPRYAGFWRRVASTILDGLILAIPINLMTTATVHSTFAREAIDIVVALIYGPWLIAVWGSTVGMAALRVRARHVDGSELTYPQALRRGALRLAFGAVTLLNLLVAHPVVVQGATLTAHQRHQIQVYVAVTIVTLIPIVVDIWWMRRGTKRQTLHDLWSHTVLVRK